MGTKVFDGIFTPVITPFHADGSIDEAGYAAVIEAQVAGGVAGLVFGKVGGGAGAGWSNTNEGKVIAAAFLDAHNQLVGQARALQAKQLPPPVPMRAGASHAGG